MLLEQALHLDPEQAVFSGHFPGNPILPGVMMLGFVKNIVSEHLQQPVRIARIKRQKFLKPLLPAQNIKIVITNLTINNQIIDVNYVASDELVPVAKGSLSFHFGTAAGKI
jgi:3-hydroxymyristoyl/3-hydroxydecanoyl-(acyl carrier protein) dehydratase